MFAAKIGCKAALARLDKVAQRVLISDKSIFIVQISSRRQFSEPSTTSSPSKCCDFNYKPSLLSIQPSSPTQNRVIQMCNKLEKRRSLIRQNVALSNVPPNNSSPLSPVKNYPHLLLLYFSKFELRSSDFDLPKYLKQTRLNASTDMFSTEEVQRLSITVGYTVYLRISCSSNEHFLCTIIWRRLVSTNHCPRKTRDQSTLKSLKSTSTVVIV